MSTHRPVIAVEQLPEIAPPEVLVPPPPPPVPQKTTGAGILPVPPPPALPPPAFFHAWQWCYALPIALNLFMAFIIFLVSGAFFPLLIALGGLAIPVVGYVFERRLPHDKSIRSKIAQRVLRWECAFFVAWEAGMFLFLPAG